MNLQVKDCSPFCPQPSDDEAMWLRTVVNELRASEHVLSLSSTRRNDDDPPIYCERDGTWWAGRYVGTLRVGEHSLTILPRFGLTTLAAWLGEVMGVVLVDSPGRHRESESFLVKLLAFVWARAFIEASKHGLPNLRHDVKRVGKVVRGRLDIQLTIAELTNGREQAAFIQGERSIDNAVGRVIAAAFQVLRRWVGPGQDLAWLPDRARLLLKGLVSAVGPHPRVPSDLELAAVRYTPITQGFEAVALLSKQIIRRKGLLSDASVHGSTQGVLLDVAELWELFVLAALKRAAVAHDVVHGTRFVSGRNRLLVSQLDGATMGNLRPDAVVLQGTVTEAVVDAKYKSLRPNQLATEGVQRADLYQLATYLSGFFKEDPLLGVLVYPEDPEAPDGLSAERRNPWRLDRGDTMLFLTLPHSLELASAKLGSALFSRLSMKSRPKVVRSAVNVGT